MDLSLITRRFYRLSRYRFELRPNLWVLFFILAGFGVRLQQLSFQPLWGDEGWSFYFATQTLPQLFALTAIDIHPPLYYMLLKGWLLILGLGAEEARLFSVMIGTALIPVLASLGRRLFDKRVGVAAAATAALMPLAIYYSQEVRMYGLVALLGAMSIYFFLRMTDRGQAQKNPSWLMPAYLLTTTAALYTHYYAAFIVVIQLLYLLLTRINRERRAVFSLALPFIYLTLLYLPWLVYAGLRLVSYVQNKRGVEGYTPLDFISFFREHLITFSLGHLPAELQDYRWAALSVIVIALLGLLAAAYSQNRRALILYLYLFGPLLSGYLINLFYPFTPRFFERTLLLAAPAYWLFVAAGLVWLWDRHYLLVGMAASAIFLIICVSLIGFYTVPRYSHEDYRPLLAEIAARSTPEDLVLASYQWQLGFYQAYLPSPRPHLLAVPGWGQGWSAQAGGGPRLVSDLTKILTTSPRLWFPAYQAGGHIWEDEAEHAISQLGYPALLRWYSPQTKLILAGGTQIPLAPASTANFENRLTLLEAEVGLKEYQAGRDIVPVRLLWQKQDSLGSDHYISLRLADSLGRTWTTRDSHPQAEQSFFTDLLIGETLVDRHGLLTPAGAPPGKYRLLLSVRQMSDAHPLDLLDEAGQPLGAELFLAEVDLVAPEPPVGIAALPVQARVEANFDRQVELVGFSLGHGPFKAGENLPLTLFWHALADHLGDLTLLIELQDAAGQPVASYQQAPIWPTSEWQQGFILRDPHDLVLPPTLAPREYRLVISLMTSGQARLEVNGVDQLELTTVTTIDRPHIFQAPDPAIDLSVVFGQQAKLVGLDVPQSQLKAGDNLPVTLYWQALTPLDKNWKIFVHLIDQEGNIVTQQDQIPGSGQFPTTGWVSNEYLIDSYNLLIPADISPDQSIYKLRIGFYDANDFSHLPVMEAGKAVREYIILEDWPISIE